MNKIDCLLGACFTLFIISPNATAEIYKWVDKNGRVHYSDKKPETDKVKVSELKIKNLPSKTEKVPPEIPYWKKKDMELQQAPEQRKIENKKPKKKVNKKIGWGGDEPETDATRCALARDIINGTAKLRNGSEVGERDKALAKSEIRRYCNKK